MSFSVTVLEFCLCVCVSPRVHCACETSTLCHHSFFGWGGIEMAKQIKGKKERNWKKQNKWSTRKKLQELLFLMWCKGASLALSSHWVRIDVYIYSVSCLCVFVAELEGVTLYMWKTVKSRHMHIHLAHAYIQSVTVQTFRHIRFVLFIYGICFDGIFWSKLTELFYK